jgi:hypothetical protein
MTIPNYLALYNLSQIEADILIVSDLTATTGTIYTLFSTTGTITTLNSTTGTITTLNSTTGNITTANITTANITTLITDLWRGTTTSSSMVIGVSGDTGTLTSYRSLIMDANKTITLNATGGKILCNVYTGTATSSNLTLGESGNTGNLDIFKTITSSNTYSGTNTYSGGNTHSGNNTFSGTNTFNNTILGNTIRGTAVGSAISLFSTTTAGITLGGSSSGISLADNTTLPASKTITLSTTGGKILCNVYTGITTSSNLTIGESGNIGTLTIYKAIVSPTISGTLSVNDIQGTNTSSSITLFTLSSVSSPTITLGNASGGTFTINPNTQLNGNLTLASGKTLTLNTTGGKILCNVYTGTTTSSNLTIGESGDTGNLQIFKTITSSNTYSGNNTYSGVNTFSGATNTFNNEILCSIYSGLTTSTNFQLGESGDSGRVNCFRDLYIQTGKIVDSEVIQTNTLRAIADLIVGNALGAASNIFLVNSITANESLTIINGKNLLCNTYRGTTAASNISLFSTTTGSLTLGGVSSGISLADNTTLATGRTLTTSTTGSILSPAHNSTSATQALSIGTTNTTANVSLASGLTTGTLFIGPNVATSNNSYPLGWSVFNSNVYVIAGRRLTMDSSSSGIFSPSIGHGGSDFAICNQAADNVANITMGSTQSTGNITLGNTTPASDSGTLTINKTVSIASGKVLTVNQIIQCAVYRSINATTALDIGGSNTTASINIGTVALTSGDVNLSNTSATGRINLRNKYAMTTNIGSAYWNVALGSANNIFQSSTLSAFAMPPVSASTSPPLANWAVWETNVQGEGAFIAMNGDTAIICNPGDTFAFHWQDEDTMGSALGFKFDKDGVMTTTSDARSKTNIKPYNKNNVLNKLNKIDIIKYNRKRPDGITRPTADQKYTKEHTGYIAQQLIEIGLDEFVEQPTTPDGYMSVSYGNIQFLFNAGVQELIKENRQQQKQIDDLTARLEKLEKLLLAV